VAVVDLVEHQQVMEALADLVALRAVAVQEALAQVVQVVLLHFLLAVLITLLPQEAEQVY